MRPARSGGSARRLGAALACLASLGCPEPPAPGADGALAAEVLNERGLERLSRWDFALGPDGARWLAYYAADGALAVRRPDGSEVDLRPRHRASAPSGLVLDAGVARADVVWRDKLPDKGLYHASLAAAGGTPELRLVDGEHEPLTRMRVARDGDEVFFLWYGEGPGAGGGADYRYHFRRGGAGGELSATLTVMPGIYPTWIVGPIHIPVFSYMLHDGRPVIAMRRYDRAQGRFGELREIAHVAPIGPFLHAVASGERWLVLWVAHQGRDFKQLLLEGAFSDDAGGHWTRFAFEELRGLDFSQIDAAADGSGNVLVAVGGAFRFRDRDAKSDVWVLASHDDGDTWSEALSLRPPAARRAHADFPSVAFGAAPGVAAIVWEDWRDVRANVHASLTRDGGRSWSEEPLPIGVPGAHNLVLDYGVKALRAHGERFHLVAARFRGDDLEERDLVGYTFTPDRLRALADAVRAPATGAAEAHLRERVASYWSAVREADHEAAYAFLDPFFRARRPFSSYREARGLIRYHDHRVEAVDLAGRFSTVRVTLEASVPEVTLGTGETVSRPRERHEIVDRWLFLDGDWFRESSEDAGALRYTRD